jgi:hypothetical protein
MGLVPTQFPVDFRGITWMTVVDGKITAGGDCWNQAALVARLSGLAPLS